MEGITNRKEYIRNRKEYVEQLINNTLEITDNHTANVINAFIILQSNNIKCKIVQGWKLNTQKIYNREAYIFIELYICSKRYFLDIRDKIHISSSLNNGVFRKKPSEKYIASKVKGTQYSSKN
mgnify:CR=1 FL=1